MKIRATHKYAVVAVGAVAAGSLVLGLPSTQRTLFDRPAMALTTDSTGSTCPFPLTVAAPDDPLIDLEWTESTILAQGKRLMGRRQSMEMISRTANQIGPVVRRTLEMPAIQENLAALADREGMALDAYKEHFACKQEADLLLESGGDPNAVSISNAVGVAQFLASTGRSAGLRINERAARPFTARMAGVQARIDWVLAQPVEWGKPAPAGTGEFWNRSKWINYYKGQWQALEARRRKVDERYDPARAIPVQTRYLVRLARRYGSIAWALQAYHGGEGGVNRTINLFRHGSPSMSLGNEELPSYEEVYRRSTPRDRTAAFYYLYGRSDDHRYYYWKVLMAERALRFFRDNPASFQRLREQLRPGMRMEVAWYGDPADESFADLAALRTAVAKGRLVPLPRDAARRKIRLGNIAPTDRAHRADYKYLRPEAMGTLLQIAAVYKANGGRSPLQVLSMVQTEATARQWRRLNPVPPPRVRPGETVEPDPEFHSTGLVFDLARPASDWDRRVLDYALGTLYDRLRISWLDEKDFGQRRYHIVPSPIYRDELRLAAR